LKTLSRLLALTFALASTPGAAHAQQPGTPPRIFGMNLSAGPRAYDSASLVYNDLMRQASGFFNFGPGTPAPLDVNGWPTRVDATTGWPGCIAGNGGFLPAGDYQIKADGVGQVAIGGGFTGQLGDSNWVTVNFDGSGTPGTVTWPVAGFPVQNEIQLVIRSSDPTNHLRNIQFLVPGAVGKFYAGFLANLAPFDTLRFMDWGATNGSPLVEWADVYASQSFSLSGLPVIPYEDWIELCNLTGKNAWINIPALASDDFIRQMARLFDENLDPRLGIYVEYSNEVWNRGMPQWGQILAQRPANSPETGDWQYIAMRDGHATNLFKSSLRPGRKCARVLARQAGYQATLTVAQQIYQKYGFGYDIIAAAAYFVTSADLNAATTQFQTDPAGAITTVLDGCDSSIAQVTGAAQIGWYKQQADIAGVPLALYEGGQSLVNSGSDASTPLLAAVNRDPRMGLKYRMLVSSLPPGIGPFCWFNDVGAVSKWGDWGAKEYTDQPAASAPKWQAIIDAARR
jgi:hypothetical protein